MPMLASSYPHLWHASPQVEHMLDVALRRFGRLELSRAWNTWHDAYIQRRLNFRVAALRFRSTGLYASLRTVLDL